MAVQQNITSRFHNLSDAALADELGRVDAISKAAETELKALATYAPVKPGDPVPVQQKMMEDFLKEIRAESKKKAAK